MDPTLNPGTNANAIIDCIAITIDRVLWPVTVGLYAGLVVTLMMLMRRGQRIGPALLAIVLLAIAAFPLEPFFQITRPPFTTWREALATAWAAVPERLELALLGLCIGAAVGFVIRAWHAHSSHAPSNIAPKAMLLIALAAAPLASGGCIRADVHLVPDKQPVAKAGERNVAAPAPVEKTTASREPDRTESTCAQEEKSREALHAEIAGLERLRDLRALERDEAINRAQEAATGAAAAEQEADRLAHDLQFLKDEKRSVEGEIAALEEKKVQAGGEANEADQRRGVLLEEVSLLEAKRAALDGEIKKKEEALADIDAELASKRQELAATTATAGRASDALASVSAEVTAHEERLAQLKKQQKEVEAALATSRSERDRATADAGKAAANLHQLRSQVETKQRELESMAARLAERDGSTTAGTPGDAAARSALSSDGARAIPRLVPWLIAILVVGVVIILTTAVRRRLRGPKRVEIIVERNGQRSQVAPVLETGEVLALEPTGPAKKPAALAPSEVPYLTPRGRSATLHRPEARPVTVNGKPAPTVSHVRAGDSIEVEDGIKVLLAGVEPAAPTDVFVESAAPASLS